MYTCALEKPNGSAMKGFNFKLMRVSLIIVNLIELFCEGAGVSSILQGLGAIIH